MLAIGEGMVYNPNKSDERFRRLTVSLIGSECAVVEGAWEAQRHPDRELRPIPAGLSP